MYTAQLHYHYATITLSGGTTLIIIINNTLYMQLTEIKIIISIL